MPERLARGVLNHRQTRRARGGRPAARLFRAALLICLAALPPGVLGHPDLLLQIENLDAQITSEPDNARLYLKRGDLYRRHQDLESAAGDFATAKRLDPGQPLLDFYQGQLDLDSGNGAAAEAHLARYLSADQRNAKAWVLRGQANIQLRQSDKAAECFAEAITNSASPSPELYRLQVLATLASGENRWVSAEEIADSGVQRFGTEVTLLGLATDIALANGQADKAAAYLAMLPPRLLELPQWAERAGRLACFGGKAAGNGDACRFQASRVIHERVGEFMTGSATGKTH